MYFGGQVSLGVGPYICTGWFEAGKIMLWSRQLWKIEGLPHSCFGVFQYRSGPTNLFPIAWPCCYRIQVHRTNGRFSRWRSLIPRKQLLLAKIISWRPILQSMARNGQHWVCNWDAACHSLLSHLLLIVCSIWFMPCRPAIRCSPTVINDPVSSHSCEIWCMAQHPHLNQAYRTLVGRSRRRLCQGLVKHIVLQVLSKGWCG